MEIIKVSSRNFKEIVEKAAGLIKKGKVLVYPTDTVYGLLADATSEIAVKKIFKIKKRPGARPLPVFVSDLKSAEEIAFINDYQKEFLKKVWPGKVTVILKRKNILPKIISGNQSTIGLRIPNYKLVNDLLAKLNFPLTGTSANISGQPASTKVKKVISQFKTQRNQPDFILDAGNLTPSLPSTVIDLTSEKPKILREGAEKTKVLELVRELSRTD